MPRAEHVARGQLRCPVQATRRGHPGDAAGVDAKAFATRYAVLAAQRNAKIVGIFVRLWKRDGKPHYTTFQPRMWGLVERNLAQPALAPVRAWFDVHVPAEKRAAYWEAVRP